MRKIIYALAQNYGLFPRTTIEEAIARREEITPLLLRSLEALAEDPSVALEDHSFMLHFYAAFLLAQFKEKRAFPSIIKLVSLPAPQVEVLFNDVITEDLQNILFSTYNGGDQAALEELVENPDVYVWVRGGAALLTLGGLYGRGGEIEEEYFLTYLRRVIANQCQEPSAREELYLVIQEIVAEEGIVAMLPDLKDLYAQDLIDITVFGGDYDEYIRWMEEGEIPKQVRYITDTVAEMEGWACFEPTPITVETIGKIGRNEPCPCGSGQKYKKCCGK